MAPYPQEERAPSYDFCTCQYKANRQNDPYCPPKQTPPLKYYTTRKAVKILSLKQQRCKVQVPVRNLSGF